MKLKFQACCHMSTMLLHSVAMNYKATGCAGLFEPQQNPPPPLQIKKKLQNQ